MAATQTWDAFRQQLLEAKGQKPWSQAYKEWFVARLESRYFAPLRRLKEHDRFAGEGFLIMTILCSLIEFLESTPQGKNYRYIGRKERRAGIELQNDEYSDSSELFKSFLLNREPFAKTFDDALAVDFYRSIRCGLIHEAQTKNGWKIKANSARGSLLDRRSRTVFRNDFHRAILTYVRVYEKDLISDKEDTQAAFVRKFDRIAKEVSKCSEPVAHRVQSG